MEWIKQEGNEIWLPTAEGEELIGKVTKINTEGLYGIQYLIKKENGDEILTNSHKVLQNRMTKAVVGTNIKIVFVGTLPPKIRGNNPTTMYEVYFS